MSVNVQWASAAPTARTVRRLKYKLAKKVIKLRLNRQDWSTSVHNNSNCINYIIFKTKSVFEDYIMKLGNVARTKLYKFRCRNHNLPVTNNRFGDANAIDTLLYLRADKSVTSSTTYLTVGH